MTPLQLRARREAVKAVQAERSLFRFLRDYAWPVLQPGTEFVDNWHVHAICEHLEAVTKGDIKRLLINLPFRMLKSTIISQAYPAWEWLAKPSIQYLSASYAKDVATRDAVDSRRIIESDAYQLAWGDRYKMTSDQNVKTRYENDKKGGRVVVSTDAAGTGFGGNRIIIDDPISALEADSETARTTAIEWFKGTVSTRMNNPAEDAIIMVHQRLHQEDTTGYVLATEADVWEHLVFPMRYDGSLRKTTSLGFQDPRSEDGELLSPKRLDDKTVSEIERRLGPYHVNAQLQQNPSSREGTIFNQKHWQFYHVPPQQIAADMEEIIWSWDCTFKDGAGTDFVSGLCIGRKGANKYLLKRINERMGFSATKTAIQNARAARPYDVKTIAVLIEDKANGPAVLDALENDVPGMIPISPQGGKVARANAVQPQHVAGNFYLPSPTMEGCEWVTTFVDLFGRFPGVKNDDDVDAWTQGVHWYTTRENFIAASEEPAVGGARIY
jgi:predicted phage terminase large subunit-like protein